MKKQGLGRLSGWLLLMSGGLISQVWIMAQPSELHASGAYVDPTKLKKKKAEKDTGEKGGDTALSDAEEEAARAAKKEALKKALLKGKQ